MTMKEALRDRLFGSLIGFQATWVADIGLTTGLFRAIADSGDGITEAGLSDRAFIHPIDAREIEFSAAFDLIYLNISLHETGGPDDYRNVLYLAER